MTANCHNTTLRIRTNQLFLQIFSTLSRRSWSTICADCGGFYGHKVWHNRENTKRYDIWYCNRRYTSAEKCKTPILRENEIETAFERICKELGIRGGQSHENLWNEMVEVVMVYPDRRLIFHMIDGREAEVII